MQLTAGLAACLSEWPWLQFLPFPRDADVASFALASPDMATGHGRRATGNGSRLRPFPWVTKADFVRTSASIGTGRIAFIVHDTIPVDAFSQPDVEAPMGPPRDRMRSGTYTINFYDAGGAGQALLVP